MSSSAVVLTKGKPVSCCAVVSSLMCDSSVVNRLSRSKRSRSNHSESSHNLPLPLRHLQEDLCGPDHLRIPLVGLGMSGSDGIVIVHRSVLIGRSNTTAASGNPGFLRRRRRRRRSNDRRVAAGWRRLVGTVADDHLFTFIVFLLLLNGHALTSLTLPGGSTLWCGHRCW